MKKIILFTLTTLLLLFNCSNSNNGSTEPPIPCNDGICLTDEQLNFFKMYLKDDTLTKKVLFEMSSMDLSSKDITSLDTGIFNNLTSLTTLWLYNNALTSTSIPNMLFTNLTNLTNLWLKLSVDTNTFDCKDTNYSTWGLDTTSLPTTFFCI